MWRDWGRPDDDEEKEEEGRKARKNPKHKPEKRPKPKLKPKPKPKSKPKEGAVAGRGGPGDEWDGEWSRGARAGRGVFTRGADGLVRFGGRWGVANKHPSRVGIVVGQDDGIEYHGEVRRRRARHPDTPTRTPSAKVVPCANHGSSFAHLL